MGNLNKHKIVCMVCNKPILEENAYGVKELCKGGGGYVHAIGCFDCMKTYMLGNGSVNTLMKEGKHIAIVDKIHIWFE